jgi:hypothetical protein
MEMKVKRVEEQSKCTIGELSFHSDFLCNTLELPMPKDGNYTHGFCIAPGRYRVELVMSPHFKFWVPRLIDVPGRDLIEMHPGNSDKDSLGCILTGMDTGKMDWIENSVGEFNAMIDILIRAVNRDEELWITIE